MSNTVEYLIAWEDGTWTIDKVDVPWDVDPDHHVRTLSAERCYRKAVMIVLFDDAPEA